MLILNDEQENFQPVNYPYELIAYWNYCSTGALH